MGIHSQAGQLIGFYWTTINVITAWYVYIYILYQHISLLLSLYSPFLIIISPSHFEWYKLWFIVLCVCVCVLARRLCVVRPTVVRTGLTPHYPFFLSAWDNFTPFSGISPTPRHFNITYYFHNSSRTCASCTHHHYNIIHTYTTYTPVAVAAEVFTNGDAQNVGIHVILYRNDNTSGLIILYNKRELKE